MHLFLKIELFTMLFFLKCDLWCPLIRRHSSLDGYSVETKVSSRSLVPEVNNTANDSDIGYQKIKKKCVVKNILFIKPSRICSKRRMRSEYAHCMLKLMKKGSKTIQALALLVI